VAQQRKTISNWLTTKYLLIVRDEENFAEKATIRFNYAKLILVFSLTFIVLLVASFFLITTLLSQWFDPRSDSLRTNQALVELEEKLDSMVVEVENKQQYIANLRMVLTGNFPVDELPTSDQMDTFQTQLSDFTAIQPIDSQFRKEFEEVDYEQLSFINSARDELQELFFFTPINGVISNTFNVREGHFGVDIVAKKNEPVKSIADGTVVMSSWTQDSGYVIAVQHRYQLISLYKHNSVLLKKVGETVKAGDIVSIIGNSGELTDGPHLHFELWYNGNPVNPEDFMPF